MRWQTLSEQKSCVRPWSVSGSPSSRVAVFVLRQLLLEVDRVPLDRPFQSLFQREERFPTEHGASLIGAQELMFDFVAGFAENELKPECQKKGANSMKWKGPRITQPKPFRSVAHTPVGPSNTLVVLS